MRGSTAVNAGSAACLVQHVDEACKVASDIGQCIKDLEDQSAQILEEWEAAKKNCSEIQAERDEIQGELDRLVDKVEFSLVAPLKLSQEKAAQLPVVRALETLPELAGVAAAAAQMAQAAKAADLTALRFDEAHAAPNMATSAIAELLGDTLVGKDGNVPTTDALAGATAVALYFSAHWCPPCQRFTPQLATEYISHYRAKGLEIVFCARDRDEVASAGYFAEMPWLALPFAQHARREALMSKFKVKSIPALVVLDAEGNTITTEGREAVVKDPTGEKLPWYPPTKEEKGRAVLDALGGLVAEAGGKPIALYFSAHWCPPCKKFTPQLATWYSEGLRDNLEVVFVSSDRDQASFDGYFREMPWKALPFEEREAKEVLSNLCGVESVPSLVVIDSGTGVIISTEGRNKVASDPTGAAIASGGWLPTPFNDVNESPGGLNEKRCVIALGNDEKIAAAVKEVAEEQFEAAGKDVDGMTNAFFFAPPGDVSAQIREMTGIPAGNKLVMLDIPDGGACYVCNSLGEGGASADDVRAFMQDCAYEACASALHA